MVGNHTHDDEEFVVEDDESADDIDLEVEEAGMNDKVKQLREKLKVCEEEKQKAQDDLQRARADFLNSRRRLEEQLERDKERATDKILSELITLVDSFDTAMMDKALWESTDQKWRTGVEAIYTKLLGILSSKNVTATDPLGLPFNPEEHEAVSNTIVEDDAQVDTITAVLQKGFVRNGIPLRPAKVVVGTK
jgi:molecular chaperone GrpE